MEKTGNKYDLTQGVIWKKLLAFYFPIVVGTLFQQLYNAVDAVVVGRFIGTEALAAVGGSAAQIIAVSTGFFVALAGGAAVVIAQQFGARDREGISNASGSSIAFSLLFGAAVTGIGVAVSPAVLRIMKTPADTMAASDLYLRIYFCGTIFVMLFNMGSSILRAVGDSSSPLWYLVASCVCNIVLDVTFVAVLNMGVAGVAIATVISQFLSAFLVLLRLCRTREAYRISLRRLRIHRGVMGSMLRLGIPSGLESSMYNLSNLIIQIAVNSLGTSVVAAWTMTGKLDGLYWAVSSAFSTAVMSFVGQNYGAGRMDRIKENIRVSFALFMALTAALVALLMGFGREGLRLFSSDAVTIGYAWQMMKYFVPYYFIWTFIAIISGTLRGTGNVVVPVVITGIGICALRLVWIATVFVRFHTVAGVCLCYPASWFVTAVAMTIYYLRGKWQRRAPAPSARSGV